MHLALLCRKPADPDLGQQQRSPANLHFWTYANQAKRNGAKLICIDPRRTETADKCHEHVALRPGSDGALALALMHELIRAMIWLDTGGGSAARLIALLPCLVGAWRHRAGGLLLSASGWFRDVRNDAALERPDLLPNGLPRIVNMSTIGDDLLREASPAFGPRIDAVVVWNSNPVAVAPESRKVVQGFAREDLFTVVLEHFLTDTADHADYVLPATTQLEHLGRARVLRPHLCADQRAGDPPLGQARQHADLSRAGVADGAHRALLCRATRPWRAWRSAPTW
jgi:anaerobic selenocysteine-containing dehydrogenase